MYARILFKILALHTKWFKNYMDKCDKFAPGNIFFFNDQKIINDEFP